MFMCATVLGDVSSWSTTSGMNGEGRLEGGAGFGRKAVAS